MKLTVNWNAQSLNSIRNLISYVTSYSYITSETAIQFPQITFRSPRSRQRRGSRTWKPNDRLEKSRFTKIREMKLRHANWILLFEKNDTGLGTRASMVNTFRKAAHNDSLWNRFLGDSTHQHCYTRAVPLITRARLLRNPVGILEETCGRQVARGLSPAPLLHGSCSFFGPRRHSRKLLHQYH